MFRETNTIKKFELVKLETMKKLIMSVAAATALLFATQTASAQEKTEEVAMNKTEVQAPVQDGFEAVEVSALPETVLEAVAADKAGTKIAEAGFNADKELYKLELTAEGVEPETAYITADGTWVKPKK